MSQDRRAAAAPPARPPRDAADTLPDALAGATPGATPDALPAAPAGPGRMRWFRILYVALVLGLGALLGLAVLMVARQPQGNLVAWFAVLVAGLSLVMLSTMRVLVRDLAASHRRLQAESRQLGQVQRQMQASRQRLQQLLDNMPDAVLAFDADGRVAWINPAARAMFQRSVADTVGQPVTRLVPGLAPGNAPAEPSAPAGMVAAPVPRLRLQGQRRDGSAFPLEVALVLLPGDDDRLSGMCVCRDLSETERVDRMKGEFVSMVSHELRTPLTSLRGALSLLTDGSFAGMPADAQRLLQMAAANSERLVMLVNDILDYEKLRAGGLRMDIEAIDLGELVPRAVESLEGMARQAHVTQRVQAADDDLPVRADPARLTQVLCNLLSNAIKHSPPNGTVHIELACLGERARVAVRDSGPGVPPAFVPKLFMPFEQARELSHRRQGGTGLGLAISRALMEAMHGSIGLDPPQPGQGACFWIELPLNSVRPSTFGDID